MSFIIHVAAGVVCRADGRTLLVRKRGTSVYMQPGGKIEKGEQPINALLRELREELGVTVDAPETAYLGCFTAPAANEPDSHVRAEVFRVTVRGPVRPGAEIEEILWLEPSAPGHLQLAPLTRDHILPLCATASAQSPT
jgi:8-oxo-dGTP diphosphatase